jgi:HK97 family phage major capsid protein
MRATFRSPTILRKIGGVFDACRRVFSMAASGGSTVRHPSLLGTLGAFIGLILMPVLVLLAIASVLHGFGDPAGLAPIGLMGITAKELRAKRANMHEQAQAVLAKPEAEKRGMNAEERSAFDKIHADILETDKDIERLERHEKVGAELAASRGRNTVEDRRANDHEPERESAEARKKAAEERDAKYAEAFDQYLRYGMAELDREQRNLLRGRKVTGGEDAAVNVDEKRAPQTVTTSGGGYLIPAGFSNKLEESLKMFGGVENACDVFETETGNSLPWPTVDDTSNTGRLLAINTAVTETALAYGVVTFVAYKFSSDMVTVPNELLQDSAFSLDAHLASVLGTRIGRVHNTYETTGTGSSQPQGIVVGSSSGVTAAGASTVTYDELLALEHSVDPAYRNPAFGPGYMLNDGSLLKLRQIKDGDGRPLWQPGIAGGAPNTINGFPYFINQDMAAMTTGLKPVLFGALKKFKVRKVRQFAIRRLDERYADLDQVAYIAFTRMDSHMLDAGTDPCKYITMA